MSSEEITPFEDPDEHPFEAQDTQAPNLEVPSGVSGNFETENLTGVGGETEFGSLVEGDRADDEHTEEPIDEVVAAFTRAAAAQAAVEAAEQRLAELLGPDAALDDPTASAADPDPITDEFAALVGADHLPPAIREDDIRNGEREAAHAQEALDTPQTAKAGILMRYNELARQCEPDSVGDHCNISTNEYSTLRLNYSDQGRSISLHINTFGTMRDLPIGYRDNGTGDFIFYPEVVTDKDQLVLQDELDAARTEFEATQKRFARPGEETDAFHPIVRSLCREQYLALHASGLADEIISRQNHQVDPVFAETVDAASRYNLKLFPKSFGTDLHVPHGEVMLEIFGCRSAGTPYRRMHYVPLASMTGVEPSDGYAPNESVLSQQEYDRIVAPLVAKMLQAEKDVPGYDPGRLEVVTRRDDT
jgi:hypothetical protein